MHESASILAALKRHIVALERHGKPVKAGSFSPGLPDDDLRLGRGLLHEILPAEAEDMSAASGFALMLALRAAPPEKPLLWLGRDIRLHAPGLAELGADPSRLILVAAPDSASLFKAAIDALRCAGLGGAVIETDRLDLTMSRRLALAAETSGVTALLLRTGHSEAASVAWTRWRVASAASTPLAANAPGAPALELDLLRHRGGRDGLHWRVEWNRDRQAFDQPASSGAVLPLSARGQAALGGAPMAA